MDCSFEYDVTSYWESAHFFVDFLVDGSCTNIKWCGTFPVRSVRFATTSSSNKPVIRYRTYKRKKSSLFRSLHASFFEVKEIISWRAQIHLWCGSLSPSASEPGRWCSSFTRCENSNDPPEHDWISTDDDDDEVNSCSSSEDNDTFWGGSKTGSSTQLDNWSYRFDAYERYTIYLFYTSW